MKKQSGLYKYLGITGVLTHGSLEEIEIAKKEYWKNYKKNWVKEKNKSNHCYKIFLSDKEKRQLSNAGEQQSLSITKFIKESALATANNQRYINKKLVGLLREALIQHYNMLEKLLEEKLKDETLNAEVLERMASLENEVYNFLK